MQITVRLFSLAALFVMLLTPARVHAREVDYSEHPEVSPAVAADVESAVMSNWLILGSTDSRTQGDTESDGEPYHFISLDEERHGGGRGHRGPFIPEPMVFDLVRSLGAGVGEAEVNVLGLINSDRVEWAPEFEMVIFKDFAVEFELPFDDNKLDSYKFAAQHTLGTAFDDKFIHGWQGIVEHRRETGVTETTLLHIGAARFDETWSTLWMLGGRAHIGGERRGARSDFLANWSVFADVNEKLVAGIETNLAVPLGGGRTNLLLMPQMHIDLTNNLQLQCGFGPRFTGKVARGEAGFRLIWSF